MTPRAIIPFEPAAMCYNIARMDAKNAKYILPNLFTLASVLFGLVSVTYTMAGTPGDFTRAAICILLAMVADSFDGRVARMTGTSTKFGIQLDSLADALSFGMAPGLLAWSFSLNALGEGRAIPGLIIVFAYVSCGIMRLARFNVSASGKGKKSNYFQGLPIPGGAGIIATMVWSLQDLGITGADKVGLIAFVMLCLSFLMVSNVPYRNFKHVRISLGLRVLMILAAALVIVAAFKTRTSYVLAIMGMVYVVMGPVEGIVQLFRKGSRRRNRQESDDDADSPEG